MKVESVQGTAKLHETGMILSCFVPGIFPGEPDGVEGSLGNFALTLYGQVTSWKELTGLMVWFASKTLFEHDILGVITEQPAKQVQSANIVRIIFDPDAYSDQRTRFHVQV